MSVNQELTVLFKQLAAGAELLGESSFRATAYARVARELKGMGEELRTLAQEVPAVAERRLAALPGIGKGSAKRILEYLETGSIREHQELLDKVPEGLFEVLEIPGLGPKAVRAMWKELGIESVDDLVARLDSPELTELPRLGPKSIENIRQAIAFAAKAKGRVPLGIARPIAVELAERLSAAAGVRRCDFAGSVRRGCETIGDLDLLVACDDAEEVRRRFTTLPGVTQVLASGASKSSVRLERDELALQADLRIVPEGTYGAALLYFTGSKDHNVRLRERAIRRNAHLNEYGLFEGVEDRPQDRGQRPIAATTEEEIYTALGLAWVPPELRQDRGELDGVPEELIRLEDIGAELHTHTTASDGRLTIEELAAEAKGRGLHTLAITDHSQSSVIAGGLAPERLREHICRVRAVGKQLTGITLLAGAEVDILPDGRLDYDDELLAELDLVVASPHAALRQDPATATRRLLRAVRHPLVDILGHPTGRLLGKRQGLEPDLSSVFAAAKEHQTALEINANWRRLDLRDQQARAALEQGCQIAVNTDAHSQKDFDLLVYGVLTARRAALTRDRCLNAWPAERLHRWLDRRRPR